MTGLPQIVQGASEGEPLQSLQSTQEQSGQTTAASMGRSMLPGGGRLDSSGRPQRLQRGARRPPLRGAGAPAVPGPW